MNKEEAIQQIEGLFPPDSEYPATNEVGERLLKQAKMEVEGWRNESDAVLVRFAELCIAEENRQARQFDRHYFSNRHGHY